MSNTIRHALISETGNPIGSLVITIVYNDYDNDVFQFDYYFNNSESVRFHVALTRHDIYRQCSILRESEELTATLEIPPTINFITIDECVAIFEVAGRKKTYPMQVTLKSYSETGDKKITDPDTVAVLRERIEDLEKQVAAVNIKYETLAHDISIIANHLLTLATGAKL
jgi:hypothetical protein